MTNKVRASIVLVALTVLIAGIATWKRLNTGDQISRELDTAQVRKAAQEQERPRLETGSTFIEHREQLLDGNFTIVERVEEIEAPCILAWRSAFRVPQSNRSIPIVNPGEIFQFSDAMLPDAPYRRLVFAGKKPSGCFIYYQHGGVSYPRFCLAVVNDAKLAWAGESRTKAENFVELRKMLAAGRFDDRSGLSC